MNLRTERTLLRQCIVIPAWNEEVGIKRTIYSCYAAGFKREDVFVLDDGSKDRTADKARSTRCQVYSDVNVGKEATIKRGIAHFNLFDRYDYLTILDADSTLDPDYGAACYRCVQQYPDVAAIAGAVRSQKGNWLTAYRATETFLSTNVYREAQHFVGAVTVAPGCSSTYRTDKFRTLDFTGGTLVEDMDWTIQFHRRGDLVVQAVDAIIHTQDPATLRQLWGQIQRWHVGTWQVIKLRKICEPFYDWTKPMTKIDSEFALIIGEAMLFGAVMMLVPLFAWFKPIATFKAMLFDQAILFVFALLTCWRDRRVDVLYTFPLYAVPRVMNYISFVVAFARTRGKQKQVAWFRPARWTA